MALIVVPAFLGVERMTRDVVASPVMPPEMIRFAPTSATGCPPAIASSTRVLPLAMVTAPPKVTETAFATSWMTASELT